jgi:hypothetical protein
MVEELESIAALLARDPLTVRQVVERLGTATIDYGSNVLVAPNNPLFREANVVRQLDRATFHPIDVPDHVYLTPAEPTPVVELSHAFGTYREVPSLHEDPPELIFYLEMRGQPYAVALIARVQGEHAIEITLRRDMRLADEG